MKILLAILLLILTVGMFSWTLKSTVMSPFSWTSVFVPAHKLRMHQTCGPFSGWEKSLFLCFVSSFAEDVFPSIHKLTSIFRDVSEDSILLTFVITFILCLFKEMEEKDPAGGRERKESWDLKSLRKSNADRLHLRRGEA